MIYIEYDLSESKTKTLSAYIFEAIVSQCEDGPFPRSFVLPLPLCHKLCTHTCNQFAPRRDIRAHVISVIKFILNYLHLRRRVLTVEWQATLTENNGTERVKPSIALGYVNFTRVILRPTKRLKLIGSLFLFLKSPQNVIECCRERRMGHMSPLQHSKLLSLRQSRVDLMTFQTTDLNVFTYQLLHWLFSFSL